MGTALATHAVASKVITSDAKLTILCLKEWKDTVLGERSNFFMLVVRDVLSATIYINERTPSGRFGNEGQSCSQWISQSNVVTAGNGSQLLARICRTPS